MRRDEKFQGNNKKKGKTSDMSFLLKLKPDRETGRMASRKLLNRRMCLDIAAKKMLIYC
jgi:hypothetical protein